MQPFYDEEIRLVVCGYVRYMLLLGCASSAADQHLHDHVSIRVTRLATATAATVTAAAGTGITAVAVLPLLPVQVLCCWPLVK